MKLLLCNVFMCQLGRYKDALGLLLREVLNRIQFRCNQAQLEELDDETLDDDVRTFNNVIILQISSALFHIICLSCSHMKHYICNTLRLSTD